MKGNPSKRKMVERRCTLIGRRNGPLALLQLIDLSIQLVFPMRPVGVSRGANHTTTPTTTTTTNNNNNNHNNNNNINTQ